jgi:hypothetical protein
MQNVKVIMNRVSQFIIPALIFLASCGNASDIVEQIAESADSSIAAVTEELITNEEAEAEDESSSPTPTQPKAYKYEIETSTLILIPNSSSAYGVDCRNSMAFYAVGLAKNTTEYTLGFPETFIEIYDGDEFLKRISSTNSWGFPVSPGEQAVFSTGYLNCLFDFDLENQGYDLRELNYEIALYADPMSNNYDGVSYSDFEFVSVVDGNAREDGTYHEVTFANTGNQESNAYLHFLYLDANGDPVDGDIVAIYSENDPGGWVMLPGDTGTRTLFMPAEAVDYLFFVTGIVRVTETETEKIDLTLLVPDDATNISIEEDDAAYETGLSLDALIGFYKTEAEAIGYILEQELGTTDEAVLSFVKGSATIRVAAFNDGDGGFFVIITQNN